MEIHQFSCREENGVDMRQANAVLKYRPDIILYEGPSNGKPNIVFDTHKPNKEVKKDLKEITQYLKKISQKEPWVMSDIYSFNNVFKISQEGQKTKIYYVDGPHELLSQTITNKWNRISRPRRRGNHLLWWVYIYLREKIMSKNIESLSKNKNLNVLVFMQKFHWLNVQFQLSKPTKDQMWEYYFGKFKHINRSNITEIIKMKNKVLYKYWVVYSDFIER